MEISSIDSHIDTIDDLPFSAENPESKRFLQKKSDFYDFPLDFSGNTDYLWLKISLTRKAKNENFKKLCSVHQYKCTAQRFAVYACILGNKEHPDVDDVLPSRGKAFSGF